MKLTALTSILTLTGFTLTSVYASVLTKRPTSTVAVLGDSAATTCYVSNATLVPRHVIRAKNTNTKTTPPPPPVISMTTVAIDGTSSLTTGVVVTTGF
jgi:hypothetical protein